MAYLVIMVLSSRYLAPPPAGWAPGGGLNVTVAADAPRHPQALQLTCTEALRTKRFYYLWAMLFINITCGIAVIAAAAPMSQEIAGLSAPAAATMVGLMGLFNGLGRIAWSSLSDSLGRAQVFGLFCILQFGLFWALPSLSHPVAFQFAVCVIISCYGGGFALMPAFIGDVFGVRELSAILGKLLTAWAVAGVVGPLLSAIVYEQTQSYRVSLYVFGSAFVVGLIFALLTFLEVRKLSQRKVPRA